MKFQAYCVHLLALIVSNNVPKRSILVSLLVGTTLTLINQGEQGAHCSKLHCSLKCKWVSALHAGEVWAMEDSLIACAAQNPSIVKLTRWLCV